MKLLSKMEIEAGMKTLPAWHYRNNALHFNAVFLDFKRTMAVVMEIAFAAEAMNHHPNWTNVYNQLDISLSTHDAGGVTEKDFSLAMKIQKIVEHQL